MYYLQSRYYNPEWGRFLNADGITGGIGAVLTQNAYTYCQNNPINHKDPSGYILETALDLGSIGWSAYDLVTRPSWQNARYLAWDVGAAALPFVPGSYVARAGKVAKTAAKRVRKAIHGNSHATTRPAVGYSLRNKDTGEILKYGETIRGQKRYTKKFYKKNNAEMHIEAHGTKKEMHKWQHEKILKYKRKNNGKRPPLNKSDY